MICERCGSNICDDSIFCSECGVMINHNSQNGQEPQTESLRINEEAKTEPLRMNREVQAKNAVPEEKSYINPDYFEEVKTQTKPAPQWDNSGVSVQPVEWSSEPEINWNDQAEQKSSKKKSLIIVLASVFSVMLIAIIAVVLLLPNGGIAKNYDEYLSIYDTVDYSVLSAKLEHFSGEKGECFIYDGDDDGREELYVTVKNQPDSSGQVGYVFETIDEASIDTGRYSRDVADKITEEGNASLYKLKSNYFYTEDYEDCVEGYKEHLASEFDGDYAIMESDFDDDGQAEYVFFISDFEEVWIDNNISSPAIKNVFPYGISVIYVDSDDEGVVFHSFFTDSFTDVYDYYYISWENCDLSIESSSSRVTKSFFCTDADNSKNGDGINSQVTSTIIEFYTDFLKENTFDNVLVRQVDICEAPGDEFVCICSDGYSWKFYACAIWNGRVIVLYEQNYNDDQAIYLTTKGSKDCLMNYIQQETGNYYSYQDYGTEYKFWCTRFDKNYVKMDDLVRSITIYGGIGSDSDGFFSELYGYLKNAIVCMDKYELMGYSIIPDKYADYGENNAAKYLSVSNCDINKIGSVRVQTFLHLREGPSVNYKLISLVPGDKNSVVMQTNGSPVTIIDTVNTMDKENPVWVKIQIKYHNNTLIGYSSQRYIDIANITHIGKGETFKIVASTNDSGLRWTSNDSSVLSVDPYTGQATGIRSGLVLVTVESDSGLTDSCLIMVD